ERAQPEEGITFAPKFKPEDRILDWTQGAEKLVRLVRALSPEEGASTRFRDRGLTVFRATARDDLEGAADAEPGMVVFAGKRGLAVKAGDGAVALEEVGLEGRKRMLGSAFVNGFRPELGERLG
ncbi:MAG TPA: methionyl-tRNA formyltransferase, partial [Actinobacteria bacterium]|nr:methionyl-tRNA formyltransferase [Actinomycetota bacterium]